MAAAMPSDVANVEYAGHTDTGRRRLANEDAFHCDQRMGLFAVCDGIGGQPSGEAASQIIAPALGHLIRRGLRDRDTPDAERLRCGLGEIAAELSLNLYQQSQAVPVLVGMGATLVASLIKGRTAFLLHAGDSRAYCLRGGTLNRLTKDHCRRARQPAHDPTLTDQQAEQNERRLLTQFVGMHRRLKPEIQEIPLEPGDRLLLCTDGLTDPVEDEAIERVLAQHKAPVPACRALVEAANRSGGPDNITAVVINYLGVRPPDAAEDTPKPAPAVGKGVAAWFRTALGRIEQDLDWLIAGARECADLSNISAFAAVKRRLGAGVFTDFLKMHPTRSPSHVFHRACTMPNSDWRRRYGQHMNVLEPNVAEITNGTVRLSPLLTPQDTALIIKTLWRDWRRVEHHYFANCQRDAISESDQRLNFLIEHMLSSARTLLGLLEFFPHFMRRDDDQPP